MSTISIILLNYNSTRLTKKCVETLWRYKNNQDTYHIVVWDANSVEAPKEKDFSSCDLVLSGKNLGFTGGNNEAAKYALKKYPDTEYLLFLNNDTRVTKNMVRFLVEAYTSDTSIGCALPKIYFEKSCEYHQVYSAEQKGRVIWYAGGGIDWKNMILFHTGVDEVDRGQYTLAADTGTLPAQREYIGSNYVTGFATGCCMLLEPAIWKKLKGFDNKYFLYYEDADLSMRLQKMGLKIVVNPKATLYHINAGSTSGSGSSLHQYYQTRNRLRFGLQYGKTRTKIALLREAKRIFFSGSTSQKLGVLHALEGRWGNQTHKIKSEKP